MVKCVCTYVYPALLILSCLYAEYRLYNSKFIITVHAYI